ncbi:hypothetical protein [Mycobacterium sp.]|uniref:hypothetical protein n=1 Tax=Mycobacterium sp. TaxID=1785 RepID=UPI003D6ABF77
MVGRLDVAARLAEGRPAVEHTQTYVAACQVIGYQHPDLTARGSQVRDWYETEAGLDLRALDDDCAALWAAVAATEEALATQRAQLVELAAAWRGPGADSAMRFLQRHCDAAAAAATRVRAAAEGCAALRDNLWQLVDGKVATAIAVDDRRLAERPGWLAAAHTVTTGVGDRSIAEEIVRRQVNPYVDNDIRTDWLVAMRSTVASVDASFDAVTDGLAALPEGCFEMAGDLGPSAPVGAAPVVSPPADAIPTMPAAAPPPPPTSVPATDPAAPVEDVTDMPDGMGDLGGAGGLGGLAGNIGGVVGRIIDGIGGLLGSLTEGLADPLSDDAALEDPLDAEEEADEAADPADPDDNDTVAPDQTPTATTDVVDNPTAPEDTAEPAEELPAAPLGESPPQAPPEPTDEQATPCEIAADELPQAGQ